MSDALIFQYITDSPHFFLIMYSKNAIKTYVLH